MTEPYESLKKETMKIVNKNNDNAPLSYIDVLSSFDLISVLLGFIIASASYQTIDSLSYNIIVPLLSWVFGENIHKCFISSKYGDFNVGKFLISLTNLIIVIILLIIGTKYVFMPILKVVKQKNDEHDKLMIKQNDQIIHLLKTRL